MFNKSTLILALVGLFTMACSGIPEEEHISGSEQAITVGASHPVGSGVGFSETSVVSVADDALPAKHSVVVGMNTSAGGSGVAWAQSGNSGLTWVKHKQTDTGFTWGIPPEAPSKGGTFAGWCCDTTAVQAGPTKMVAMVAISFSSQPGPPATQGTDVTIVLSQDSGAHFGTAHIITTPSSGVDIDQPVAAYNVATNKIWVWWRQPPSGVSWVRAMHYTTAGALVFDTPPVQVNGLAFSNISNANIGVGMDGAGVETVFLAYPSVFDSNGCPQPLPTEAVTWSLSWSKNNGATWSNETIATDNSWPFCVTSGPVPGNNQNRNRPEFAFDTSTKTCFVAFNMSGAHGTLVHVFESTGFTGTWTDRTFPADVSGSVHDQFGQALAFERSGTNPGRLERRPG